MLAWLRRNRVDVASVVLFLAVVAPWVQTLTAQGATRYALTAALVEQQTFRLDDYEALLSFDRVDIGDHVYSDKAPGQPVLGVPVLAVAEAFGADPGTEIRARGNLGAWSQTFVFSSLAGAVLLVLMRRHSIRYASPPVALLAAGGLAGGTLLLPMASALYAHVFVATLTFGAWHLLSRDEAVDIRTLLAAGALAATATVSEYPMIATGGILCLYVLWRFGIRAAAVVGAPQVLAVALIVIHNRAVYGSTSTGYTAKTQGGTLNFVNLPKPSFAWEIFFGEKGFLFTPVVIVGIAGLVIGLRDRRWELLVPAAIFGGFFVLQAGWGNPWGGEAPGPRYLTPALPFLVAPVALGLERLSRLARATIVGIGAGTMLLALTTLPIIPRGEPLIGGHIRNLERFGVNPTIFTLALGPAGWALHAALLAVAGWWFVQTVRADAPAATAPRPPPA